MMLRCGLYKKIENGLFYPTSISYAIYLSSEAVLMLTVNEGSYTQKHHPWIDIL